MAEDDLSQRLWRRHAREAARIEWRLIELNAEACHWVDQVIGLEAEVMAMGAIVDAAVQPSGGESDA